MRPTQAELAHLGELRKALDWSVMLCERLMESNNMLGAAAIELKSEVQGTLNKVENIQEALRTGMSFP